MPLLLWPSQWPSLGIKAMRKCPILHWHIDLLKPEPEILVLVAWPETVAQDSKFKFKLPIRL